MGNRGRKFSRKPNGKALTESLSKRVEKYDLIDNLSKATACITFVQIARGDIDFAKLDL